MKCDFSVLRKEMQQIMNDYGGVLRSEQGMKKAIERITEIYDTLAASYCPGRAYIETLNLAALSAEILEAALARKESVGAHYRED